MGTPRFLHIRMLFVAAVAVGLLGRPLHADDELDKLLDKLNEQLQQVESLHHATTTITVNELKDKSMVRRELWEVRQGENTKYRLETVRTVVADATKRGDASAQKSAIVCDGAKEWREMRAGEAVMVFVSKPTKRDEFLELRSLLSDGKGRYKTGEQVAGEPCYLVEIVGTDAGTSYKAKYLISEKYGMILEKTLSRSDGASTKVETTSLDVNKPIDAARFSYEPPPGAKVIDVDQIQRNGG